MKIKKLLSMVSIFAIISISGCDSINSLNTFPLNVPLSVEINVAGNFQNIAQSGDICLDQSDTYQKYKDKIKNITFLQAAFRTLSVTPSNLSGNVTLKLEDGNGNLLFNKNLGNIKPSDYINTPYILPLTSQDIANINAYISVTGNQCFNATVTVTGLPGGSDQAIDVSIDMVFQSDTKF